MSNDSGSPRRIALGLTRHLVDFARRHDAEIWTVFARPHPARWQYYFLEAMDDPLVTVYFNLTGIDVWAGVLRASRRDGGPTDWELLQIQQHDGWWPRIIWRKDGVAVPNPFE